MLIQAEKWRSSRAAFPLQFFRKTEEEEKDLYWSHGGEICIIIEATNCKAIILKGVV